MDRKKSVTVLVQSARMAGKVRRAPRVHGGPYSSHSDTLRPAGRPPPCHCCLLLDDETAAVSAPRLFPAHALCLSVSVSVSLSLSLSISVSLHCLCLYLCFCLSVSVSVSASLSLSLFIVSVSASLSPEGSRAPHPGHLLTRLS